MSLPEAWATKVLMVQLSSIESLLPFFKWCINSRGLRDRRTIDCKTLLLLSEYRESGVAYDFVTSTKFSSYEIMMTVAGASKASLLDLVQHFPFSHQQ